MDPLTVGVIVTLGKYALDKASDIIPVLGAEASRIIDQLFGFVTEHLSGKGTKETVVTEGFKSDPETFEKPFAKLLEEEIKANPAFSARIRELVNEYNDLADARGVDNKYKISVSIKGDVSATGSILGSGTVIAKGDIVGGDKTTTG